jgi:hypothetical protein
MVEREAAFALGNVLRDATPSGDAPRDEGL